MLTFSAFYPGLRNWAAHAGRGGPPRCPDADGKVSSHIMPGDGVASRYADLRRQEALTPKVLYAVDATVTPSSPVADVVKLTEVATRRAGGERARP
jgi:hypothetical protein